jgi:hypothetical protein
MARIGTSGDLDEDSRSALLAVLRDVTAAPS